MKATLTITIDGEALTVPEGISVAAALALTGDPTTRQAVNGELRAPFCGMGVCQECRVTVDGLRVLACQTLCRTGMQIERSHDEHAAL
ncbi:MULTISPECIES: (2Fe-2S)-binding protein [Klebsiella]|uniref:(2Fe-2S)-binding protein n=1 Tax=Klebsiella TaxID=570 RepID=UPI000667164C|nr:MULTISPECIES: (2Fe-2S)-binding protein [Klebsiella]AQL14304.1 (2Fe-2S)-binding protein [Klebsiella variicola]AQL19391.1 (2Fe-2S)-binding protein [Klebsiella variicola]AQL25155.1 (2Fe-2S)-binding protein [Klebsiella variicola]ELA0493395.1 (2Fe-2S)-binding protein [Klebsiella variicola]KAA0467213.1 (2Fe-2S)-binding protein [Klebsiella variicola]